MVWQPPSYLHTSEIILHRPKAKYVPDGDECVVLTFIIAQGRLFIAYATRRPQEDVRRCNAGKATNYANCSLGDNSCERVDFASERSICE
jgi:hypothetical protein